MKYKVGDKVKAIKHNEIGIVDEILCNKEGGVVYIIVNSYVTCYCFEEELEPITKTNRQWLESLSDEEWVEAQIEELPDEIYGTNYKLIIGDRLIKSPDKQSVIVLGILELQSEYKEN